MCIERYKNKNRYWRKKVQYEQRKEVADNRLRISGRFISRKDKEAMDTLLGEVGVKEVFEKKHNLDVQKLQHKVKLPILKGI